MAISDYDSELPEGPTSITTPFSIAVGSIRSIVTSRVAGRPIYYRRYHGGGRCECTGFFGLSRAGPVHWTGLNELDGLPFGRTMNRPNGLDLDRSRPPGPVVGPSGALNEMNPLWSKMQQRIMIRQKEELDLASYLPGGNAGVLYHSPALNHEDAMLVSKRHAQNGGFSAVSTCRSLFPPGDYVPASGSILCSRLRKWWKSGCQEDCKHTTEGAEREDSDSSSADLHAEKEAPKALDFRALFTSMCTPLFPQHDKAQHY
ncbi:hypothetical protein BDR22DRAFT_966104 [Usnea florida]